MRGLRQLCVAVGCAMALAAFGASSRCRADAAYDRWIDTAVDASALGDWPRAYDAFQHAHALDPNARTWRGLGVVSYRMGRYERAFVELGAALRDQRQPLSRSLREGVVALVGTIAPLVGFFSVEVEPANATWTLDDATPQLDDSGRVVSSLGQHTLRVRAEGYEAQVITFDVSSGAEPTERVVLVRTEPSPAPTVPAAIDSTRDGKLEIVQAPDLATAASSNATLAPERAHEPAGARTWTWVAAAGVPVFALAAGASWLHVDSLGDGIASRCDRTKCSRRQRADAIDASPLSTYETLTNVGIGLSITSAVVAGVLFVLEAPNDESHAQLRATSDGLSFRMEL